MRPILLIFAATLLSCAGFRLHAPVPVSADGWSQAGRNAQHTAYDDAPVRFPAELAWQRRFSVAIDPVLSVVDEYVFFGTLDGKVQVVSLLTGKSLGRVKIRNNVAVTLGYHQGSLIVFRRSAAPYVQRYDLQTAKTIWKRPTGFLLTEPLITDDHVYVAGLDGRLSCFAFADGAELHHAKLPAFTQSTPAFADDHLVLGDDDGHVLGYSSRLQKLWQFDTGASVRAMPVMTRGKVFVGSTDQIFYALDLATGREKWRYRTEGKIYHAAAVTPELVIFGSADRTVVALDQETGTKIWSYTAGSVISTQPTVSGGAVFFGSLDKKIYALDVHNGAELWSYTARGRVRGHPVVMQNRLLFSAEDDYLYCFTLK